MEHFIECVRRYPCLWNTNAIEYRDQELKDAAWAEVMKETELSSVKEVKLKWKKLRDSYRDALKRQSETQAHPGGGGGVKKTYPWKYTAQMQFLQPFMSNRKKASEPVAEPPPPPVHENGHHRDRSEPEPEPDSESESELSQVAAPAPVAVPLLQVQGGRKRTGSPDPLETFFAGMCQATQRLPFPAQLRIKRALFEAVAAGEEALLAEHRRYAAAAAAAAAAASAAAASAAASSSDEDATPA